MVASSSQRSEPPNHFVTTQWSVVIRAVDKDDSGVARKALAELCGQYWYPLYCFVRRKLNSPHDSADVVQAFFVQLLEKESIEMADQSRGRFRNFLLASINNFLKNRHRQAMAIKRGGTIEHFSIDFDRADQRYKTEPADHLTPEKIFERSWALELIDCCLKKLHRRYCEQGQEELFSQLCSSLLRSDVPYAKIAEHLDMNETAVKVAAHRMRQRLRDEIREEVANTVEDGSDIDMEIQHLMNCVGST